MILEKIDLSKRKKFLKKLFSSVAFRSVFYMYAKILKIFLHILYVENLI